MPYYLKPYKSKITYYNPSVIQNLFTWNMFMCFEDNSGLILVTPWYCIAVQKS